jgi:CheY-like chemotaxis protein
MKAPETLTVLLAEDDFDLRSMLSSVLRRDGYRVVEMCDGIDLQEHLALHFFAGAQARGDILVVADLRMPLMDSLSVLRTLRGQGHRPPFILITAFGDPQTHADARALDAVAVLDKPFDFDDLRRTVREFASARQTGGDVVDVRA